MKKSRVIQDRHRARELAVQLLYSLGTRPDQNSGECLGAFISDGGLAFEEEAEVKEYLSFLVDGTWERRFDIDNKMRMIVTGWRPEHMVAVDRAVLRLAIFEGFLAKKVPLSVAIAEAVELARAFGTEDSAKFVNGVLGKMARDGENASDPDEASTKTSNSNKDDENATAASKISTDR
ncbi:MAG: transcription antitermination factor NusB [Synergistaceae bacterium]|nr:transcription antitermination factor NusB [Synergistaceae bacterium]